MLQTLSLPPLPPLSFLTDTFSEWLPGDHGQNRKHCLLGSRRRRDDCRFALPDIWLSPLTFYDPLQTLFHALKTGEYAKRSASIRPCSFNSSILSKINNSNPIIQSSRNSKSRTSHSKSRFRAVTNQVPPYSPCVVGALLNSSLFH